MSQPGTLPSVDDFFGSTAPKPQEGGAGALPSADEFFAPPKPSFWQQAVSSIASLNPAEPLLEFGAAAAADLTRTNDAQSSPALDQFFTSSTAGRTLKAFGQSAAESWGARPLGFTPETEADLRKAGIFNDYVGGHTSIVKTINEAFMRPAATTLDAIMRAGVAIPHGAGVALRAYSQDNPETITGTIAGASGEMIGAIPEGFLPESLPHGTYVEPAARVEPTFAVPPVADLARARSLAVIGEGEDAYFGTRQPEPESAADRAAATREVAANQPPVEPIAPPEAIGAAPPVPEPTPDIHTVARQIAPDTFTAYDALAVSRDTFRRWLIELADTRENDPRIAAANAEVETILGKVSGVEDRLTKKAADRLDAIRDEVDQFRRNDTPDMALIRKNLQDNDFKMRDIAPQVAAAYRAAQERIGEPAPAANAAAPLATAEPVAAPQEAPSAETPAALEAPAGAPAAEAVGEPIQGQIPAATPAGQVPVPDIASDVQRKLVAAGRPAEEASAAAQIVAEHYAARASRLRGATAEDLYRSDAPEIRVGQRRSARSPEMAQGKSASINIRKARTTIRLFENADASSFMHESGHQWLEELMADAGDERANDAVRTDAANVRDWLGVKEGETIPTKAHEKFARGFERYLMEGVAPSQKLAAVFAKFKAWLTQIYQTVQKLRSPIHDDIRSVFDRLVTANPERAVIAPEREMPSVMADTHERLAEETPPEQAASVADKVRAEIDAHVAEVAPDIAKELQPVIGYKTAKGSTYEVHDDGTTTRNKAARADAGHEGDSGPKPRSAKTIYADTADGASALSAAGVINLGPKGARVIITGDKASLLTWNEKAGRWGIAPSSRDIPISTTPAVGKAPLELWKPADDVPGHEAYRGMHAGNPITEVTHADPPKPTGRLAESNAPVTGGSNEAGARPAADVTAAESGAVAASGDETQAEGSAGRTGGTTPEPTAANERFAERESPLVDKAGNIRLENLGTPEDVSAVIRDTAKGHNDFITARRGVLTDGEVLDLADAIGMDSSALNARKIGQAFNAEQIVAARKLLIKSATDVRDKMSMAATGSDADVMAYAQAKLRHNMIQEQVAGLTAEAGRALRAFHKLEGGDEAKAVGDFLKEATGRTLNQLRMEAKLGSVLQTPAQVSRFAQMTTWQKVRAAILEYYVNCLISGPVTHFRYAVGNAINAIVAGGIDTPIAAGIGAIRNALGLVENGDRVYLGEAGAQMLAITKGSRDGFSAGYEAFRAGVSPTLPGERASEVWSAQRAIPGTVGTIINVPSKSVSAIHSFFKSLRYEQNMQAMAYRTASKEGLSGRAFDNRVADLTLTPSREMMDAWEDRESYDELETALAARDIARGEGLSGDALDSRVAELVASPTPEIKAALDAGTHTETARIIAENAVAATKDSLRELYLSPTKYGSTSAWINKAINSNIVTKIMVPFMKIGIQITRNAFVERTPLGFVDKDVRDNLLGKNGGAAQDMQWARITTGTAVIGITALMAAEGLATGDGPEDPRQRATWLLTHKPNTVTIGDITMPYQGLGSLGMLMRFSANAVQTASMVGHDSTGDVAVAALEGLSKSVLDENYMRGIKDALDAIYHPEEYGSNYIKGFVTNWLPFSVGQSQIARQIDPYQRDTKAPTFWDGLINTMKAKTPFISENLLPRRDMFGLPIPQSGSLQTYANDPVVREMDALQIGVGLLPRKIRGIDLTDAQYDDFGRTAGGLTKMQLDAIVRIPGFDSLPASTRIEMIQKAISSSRETARALVMMRSVNSTDPDNPDIVRAAIAAKADIRVEQDARAP